MEYDINEPFLNYKENEEGNDEIEKQIMEKIREGFITKVYGILIYQVVLTSIVVYFALVSSSFQEYLLSSPSMYYLCTLISLICLFLPLCSPKIYQSVPSNYIVLTIFTLSYSWIIATMTCLYTFRSVMVALFLTFVTVVTLTIYAWKTKKDFTIVGGTLLVTLVLLIFSSLIFLIIPIPFFNLITLYISLVLFSVYLIYDTQLICGKGRIKFSEDDYILAAINIYLDIVILFVKILSIFGEKK
jgi:FtsH-binding integral membrane protein